MADHPERDIGPEEFERNTRLLTRRMMQEDYFPDAVVGILHGGVPAAGFILDEYRGVGHDPLYIAAKAHSYTPDNQQSGIVTILLGQEYGLLNSLPVKSLLFTDEISESAFTEHGFVHAARNGLKRCEADVAYELDGRCSLFRSGLFDRQLGDPIGPHDAVRMSDGRHFVYEFSISNGYRLRVPLLADVSPLRADLAFAFVYYKPQLRRIERAAGVRYFEEVPVTAPLAEDVEWLNFFWNRRESERKNEERRKTRLQSLPNLFKTSR